MLAAGVVPVREVALVHDDPPYGQRENTARNRAGRGLREGINTRRVYTSEGSHRGTLHARDFPPVQGDEKPYDPAPVLALDRRTVTWGAQRYAPLLPASPSWLWWGKRDGSTPDDNGDGELAWTNLGGPPREFQHLWRGTCRASETGRLHLAPTQKPIALSVWVYARAKLKRGDLVLVPHGGSGPDLPACRAAGLRLIWCDVEAWCCDVAIARLPDAPIEIVARAQAFQRRAVTAERAATPAGPLFTWGAIR